MFTSRKTVKTEPGEAQLLRAEFVTQWAILALAALAAGALLGYSELRERRSVEREEGERLRSQVRLIEKNLVQQLDSINEALQAVAQDLGNLRNHARPATVNNNLRVLEKAMPGIRTLLVLDSEGKARFSNRQELLGMDLSGRDYFRAVKRDPDPAKLYISPPFASVLGVRVMNLNRVLSGPKGEFEGIVTAALDPEFFDVLLSSSLYAPDMWTAVGHADGQRFVKIPSQKDPPGQDSNKPDPFLLRHAQSGNAEDFSIGAVDETGRERMTAFRDVRPSQPDVDGYLVVAISRDLGAAYSEWRKDVRTLATSYGVLVLLLILFLWRYQRNKQAVAEEILQDELMIRQLHEELDRFFDMSVNLLSITDTRGNFERVNRVWEEVLGHNPETLRTTRYLDLIHEDDRQATVQAAKEMANGKPMNGFVNRCRHRDGTYRWIEWHAVPFGDRSIYGVAQDITARRLMEQEREELIASLRTALENVKTLKGLLPICAWCRKVRDDAGYWQQLESYVAQSFDVMVTHGMCPDCATKFSADLKDLKKDPA